MRKQPKYKVPVWDLPTRVFHWSTVVLFALLWWSGHEGGDAMELHTTAGYGMLALVLFRLCWGITGSHYARFRNFLYHPAEALRYARQLFSRQPSDYVGHNPLGGWMVVLMLLGLLVQAVTGLFATDDIFIEGPLYHLVAEETSRFMTYLHYQNFNLLLAMSGLHIAAILFYRLIKGDDLILPMLTGHKWLPQQAVSQPSQNLRLALGMALLIGGAVYWLVS